VVFGIVNLFLSIIAKEKSLHLTSIFIDNKDEEKKGEGQYEIGIEIHHPNKKCIDYPKDDCKYGE